MVGRCFARTPKSQCLPSAQNVRSSSFFFFYVGPHEVSTVFCIARFLYINSIHIYTKRDVLWMSSVCACHSAIGAMCKYHFLGALKSGMTEQDTGALSTEHFFVLCCCTSRLLVKALLSCPRYFSPFCLSSVYSVFLLPGRQVPLLSLCVCCTYVTKPSHRCLPVETNTAPQIVLGMSSTNSSVPHVRMHSALLRTLETLFVPLKLSAVPVVHFSV